jgi:hypothetical protein
MLLVTNRELEQALAEAGFMRPKIEGSFTWVWRKGRGGIAWVYNAQYISRMSSVRAVQGRLRRALSRFGPVEIRWAYADEADFYFLADLSDPDMPRDADDEDEG